MPVKSYSSGMYVRLAFAVAAHLEPDILIVDEVLAVGDAAFQTRCINHFEEMQGDGKTILLISHNMSIVNKVCKRAILLEQGQVRLEGPPGRVIDMYGAIQYSGAFDPNDHAALQARDPLRWGNGEVKIATVRTLAGSRPTATFGKEPQIEVEIAFEACRSLEEVVVGLTINHSSGLPIFATNSQEMGIPLRRIDPQRRYFARFSIDNSFGDGLYTISCAVNNHDRTKPYSRLENAHMFEVSGRTTRSIYWPRHSLSVESEAST
jgi:hypothetical protein